MDRGADGRTIDESAPTVRILIADDHPVFRDGLRRLLEAEPGFQVIGEASDGVETVRIARQLEPDIVLLDLAMPHAPGLAALKELAELSPRVRTLILTAAVAPAELVQALQLGARGVFMKDCATQLLFKSIRSVMAGQFWVGRESVGDLVQVIHGLTVAGGREASPSFGLTPREQEIVVAVAAGCTNKDIARQLSISEHTVKHHLTSAYDKLGVSNRLELALMALQHGLADNH